MYYYSSYCKIYTANGFSWLLFHNIYGILKYKGMIKFFQIYLYI